MSQRGRTGVEGRSVKAYAAIVAVIGLGWLAYAWLIMDPPGSVWKPILLVVAGVIAFMVGRSLKK